MRFLAQLNAFLFRRAGPRLRGLLSGPLRQVAFHRLGRHNKIYGGEAIHAGQRVCIGDFCWIEAVVRYGAQSFQPAIVLRDGVMISDMTHISAVSRIEIGRDCLLGSKIYIGDHSHGTARLTADSCRTPPGRRPLDDIAEIAIGDDCWIGDGAVILAGSRIAAGSIVAANAVVKLQTDKPALIAGNPAKVVRYFE
ncbi:hypothetical protein ACPRNU_17415 [Chromobacterium vaccinii]|uniref:hypothetical protein n=1 Tax=Chromobacterium vaccinii TaxID=1108595 RepID=UPI003C72AA84